LQNGSEVCGTGRFLRKEGVCGYDAHHAAARRQGKNGGQGDQRDHRLREESGKVGGQVAD